MIMDGAGCSVTATSVGVAVASGAGAGAGGGAEITETAPGLMVTDPLELALADALPVPTASTCEVTLPPMLGLPRLVPADALALPLAPASVFTLQCQLSCAPRVGVKR